MLEASLRFFDNSPAVISDFLRDFRKCIEGGRGEGLSIFAELLA